MVRIKPGFLVKLSSLLFIVGLGFYIISDLTSRQDNKSAYDESELDKYEAFEKDSRKEDQTITAFPKLNSRQLGNYEPKNLKKRSGPGEYGAAVSAADHEKVDIAVAIKRFGFNMVNSDKISLDRLPKDLRHAECKHWNYPDEMSNVSVIIVFHNEGWSTLMRTVHSVINLTPPALLAEIVMIDDYSTKGDTHIRLPQYVQRWGGLVRVHRNARREGLIRARSIGAQQSSLAPGRILVYLDAHCEVGYNWLPPLIMPIMLNRMVTTVPLIDVINGQEYTFEPQAGGDSNGFARGAWDWSMMWKRIPLDAKERRRRNHVTEPYRSPAMAGGLFAIDREYFHDIGLYDPGLEIWGGENYELSFKIWMCGGEVLFVPCSRVGHVYRLPGWEGNPPPSYVPSNPSLRNYVRVVEVWWDEYAQYFYTTRPDTINLPYGAIDQQVKYRRDHECKSFQWFMDTIAYDVIQHYPLPSKNVAWGEIRGFNTTKCLDSMGHHNGDGPAEVGPCHNQGGNQLFRVTGDEQIMQNDQCLFRSYDQVSLTHCDTTQFREWRYSATERSFHHTTTRKCLEHGGGKAKNGIFLAPCDPSRQTQQWSINKVVAT